MNSVVGRKMSAQRHFFNERKRPLKLTDLSGLETCLKSSAIFESIIIELPSLNDDTRTLLMNALLLWRPAAKITLELVIDNLDDDSVKMIALVFHVRKDLYNLLFKIRTKAISELARDFLSVVDGEIDLFEHNDSYCVEFQLSGQFDKNYGVNDATGWLRQREQKVAQTTDDLIDCPRRKTSREVIEVGEHSLDLIESDQRVANTEILEVVDYPLPRSRSCCVIS